jgi:hypothetical protein
MMRLLVIKVLMFRLDMLLFRSPINTVQHREEEVVLLLPVPVAPILLGTHAPRLLPVTRIPREVAFLTLS